MDQDQVMEQDWARGLFDRARAAGTEAPWTADAAAAARAGGRQRRARSLGMSGGVLAVVAVTAVVAVGMGGGPAAEDLAAPPAATSTARPVGSGWGDKPLRQVAVYLSRGAFGSKTNTQHYVDGVPKAALQDAAAIVGGLDPTLGHLRSLRSGDDVYPPVLADEDPAAKDIRILGLNGRWLPDPKVPPAAGTAYGEVSVTFASNDLDLGLVPQGQPDVSTEFLPCGYSTMMMMSVFNQTNRPHWSTCDVVTLPDGSKVDTASTPDGAGTVYFAARRFPGDKGGVTIEARDFPDQGSLTGTGRPGDPGAVPDPATVLKPSPFSGSLLRSVLSASAIGPGLTPDGITAAPAGFLQAADLGADWSLDPAGSHGTTSEYVMDDGCAPDHSVFNLRPGRTAGYLGTLPGGTHGAVYEGEYKLPSGTGAATFAQARHLAAGGCTPAATADFSKDTVTDLPAGIGDGGFVQMNYGDHVIRTEIRFGDTVLMVDVSVPGQTDLPDLTSPPGKAWLAELARQAAVRWTAAR